MTQNNIEKLIEWAEMVYATLDSNEEHNTSEMDAYANVIAKAKQLQQESLSQESDWVSVEKELPPKGYKFFAFNKGEVIIHCAYAGTWDNEMLKGNLLFRGTTHWMPITKPK